MSAENESRERLVELVRPITDALADISLADPEAAEAELDRQFPMAGEIVQSVRAAMVAGQEQGWLLPKEAGGMRFGRVAKDVGGYSVDAVFSASAGPKHRHPDGEVDLLFRTSGDPMFDGRSEGWAVYGPGSEHVPAVSGGEMLILYLLPGGAIEWVS